MGPSSRLFCFILFLWHIRGVINNEPKTVLKILTPEEATNLIKNSTRRVHQELDTSRSVPPDNGAPNYGDLILGRRQNGDVLLVRDVVLIEQSSDSELEAQWYTRLDVRRISTVRALNLGRQRAYCVSIDVSGGEAQVVLRNPPYFEPRLLIEVYGFWN